MDTNPKISEEENQLFPPEIVEDFTKFIEEKIAQARLLCVELDSLPEEFQVLGHAYRSVLLTMEYLLLEQPYGWMRLCLMKYCKLEGISIQLSLAAVEKRFHLSVSPPEEGERPHKFFCRFQ